MLITQKTWFKSKSLLYSQAQVAGLQPVRRGRGLARASRPARLFLTKAQTSPNRLTINLRCQSSISLSGDGICPVPCSAERRQGPCGPLPLIPSPQRKRGEIKQSARAPSAALLLPGRAAQPGRRRGHLRCRDGGLRGWQEGSGVHRGCRLGQLSMALHRSHLSGASCHVNPKGTQVRGTGIKPGASLTQKPVS